MDYLIQSPFSSQIMISTRTASENISSLLSTSRWAVHTVYPPAWARQGHACRISESEDNVIQERKRFLIPRRTVRCRHLTRGRTLTKRQPSVYRSGRAIFTLNARLFALLKLPVTSTPELNCRDRILSIDGTIECQ